MSYASRWYEWDRYYYYPLYESRVRALSPLKVHDCSVCHPEIKYSSPVRASSPIRSSSPLKVTHSAIECSRYDCSLHKDREWCSHCSSYFHADWTSDRPSYRYRYPVSPIRDPAGYLTSSALYLPKWDPVL